MKTKSVVFLALFALVCLAFGSPASAQQQAYPGAAAYGQPPAAYPGQVPPGLASQMYGRPAYVPQSYINQVAMQQPQPRQQGAIEAIPDSGSCDVGCGPVWQVYGEFLFLRPRNAEVAYAATINGAVLPPPGIPIQTAPIALVDPNYTPAFKVGIGRALDECTSIGAAYTRFESQTTHATSTVAPNVIASLVSHPGSASAATAFLRASATYGLDFELADAEYRGMFSSGERYILNYLVGARYAGLRQDFRAQFATNNVETVNTVSNFDGGGIRVGLEGERYSRNGAWTVYGKSTASFVGGEFRSTYTQDNLIGTRIVDTGWRAGRLVTILDLEVGVGWISPCEHWRLSAGYMVSGWFNVVKTDEWIKSVQRNNFVGLGDTLTFDGLTARAELRF